MVRSFFFILSYGAWVTGVRLLTLTFITYFERSSLSSFQEISHSFSSHLLTVMGVSSFLFILLYQALSLEAKMHTPTSFFSFLKKEFMPYKNIKQHFISGFIQGICVSLSFVMALLILGYYRFLGFFIPFDNGLFEGILELTHLLLRIGSLISLSYCETYLFHFKLAQAFIKTVPKSFSTCFPTFSKTAFAIGIALFFSFIKSLQFELDSMQKWTLFLVSLTLFFQTLENQGNFVKSAAFWAGILITFHPLLGLPLFGNPFSGILLLKHHPSDPEKIDLMTQFLTGSTEGPLSSFAFQLVLILKIGQHTLFKTKG